MVGTEITRAQNEREFARMGNKALEAGKYDEALEFYNKALNVKPDMPEVKYNMALAKLKSEEYEEAAEKFNEVTLSSNDKNLKSKAFHNMGNSFLHQEKWQEGADAFKKALMNNPTDEDSRYNLSYALKKLQEQQEDEEDENEDDENNDDENNDDENDDDSSDEDENDDGDEDEDGSDQDEDQDGDDEEDGEGNDDDGDEEEDGDEGSDQNDEGEDEQDEQGQQPNQLSQEDAERLLDALLNEERQVQEGLDKKKGQPVKGRQIEKEW